MAELKAASYVFANMEGFAFEGITFTPQKYTVVFKPKRGEGQVANESGNLVSAKVKAFFNSAKPGDMIILGGIQAKSIAGTKNIPTSLSLTVR